MTTGPTAFSYSGRLDGGRGRGESLICCRGEWVLLWIYPFQWHDFCAALDLSALESDPRFATGDVRQANWAAFMALMQQRFTDVPADEVVARLQARRLITAKASSLTELVVAEAHLQARGFWQKEGDGLRLRRPFTLEGA
jgi:crotonobetainyl-CoA:carnitine CoA-transferase CaiB-like acyl-CoA transferase